jgi:hypothetical protein
MILYGWNSYLLKAIQLHDLGILRTNDPDMRIEYRQKYFHLFFIPVFPLGKFWAVKQQGKLYQPAAQLQQELQSVKINTKNWIWSWTGILLALGVYFIYSFNAKMENYNYKKRNEANATVLNSYFKDEKSTVPVAKKLFTINYLMDSSVNDEDYEKKKIDTSTSGMLKLYFDILGSQKDSLTGYNKENTLIFSCINHTKNRNGLPGDNIKKALNEGVWSGYDDTASVFKSIQLLRDYKYLLVLKEYNRANPVVMNEGYAPGISLVNGTVINIDNNKIEHKFKVMATNSDTVNYVGFRRKGESDNVMSSEWYRVLESDLNKNILKKGIQYVLHQESVTPGSY